MTKSILQLTSGVAAAVLASVLLVPAQSTKEGELLRDAQAWLFLLDHKQYEESWKQASSTFRNEVKVEVWKESLKRFREPMGALVSRKSPRVDFFTTLKGAPDGEYAVIHYQVAFEKQESATERLTLVREDGAWKTFAFAIH